MKKPREVKRASDEAVKAKTGKVWGDWFKILDKAGAKKWAHKEIAAYLHEKQKTPPWWSQMVTVEYERARGLRGVHQKAGGDFAASASRTFDTPATKIYNAWTDEKLRRRWLPGAKIEITTAKPGKSLRAKWNDTTRLSVYFYGKGEEKTQIAVDHMKLTSTKESAKMKSYWFNALNRLEMTLAE
jgi:hypothetical protein